MYREKKYGKGALIVFAIVLIAIAGGSIFGGVYAVNHMSHWSKYIIVSVAGIFGIATAICGFLCLSISFSMINEKQSVRDGNDSIGIANTHLCDKCGRVISENASVCEHCGATQTGKEAKKCPDCGTKNSPTASYCEKCGYKFEE